MGEHHCTDCTIVSRGGWWGGAGFDGPQVTSCLRVCQHLWLESSVVPGLKPDVRQRLPFPKWLSLCYWGQDGIPSFLSRNPEYQPGSGCVPSRMYAPLTQHCKPCHTGPRGACSGWKNNKRSKYPCWLLTEIQATSNVPSVPSPSVVSPSLLKHTFWSEISWFLTADNFPRLLLCLPCGRGVLLGR